MQETTKEDICTDIHDTLKVLFQSSMKELPSLGRMTMEDLEWLSASLDNLWSEVRGLRTVS